MPVGDRRQTDEKNIDSELIGIVYEVAFDPHFWPDLLESISQLFNDRRSNGRQPATIPQYDLEQIWQFWVKIFFLCLCIIASGKTFADIPSTHINNLLNSAKNKSLHNEKQWLSLLHYRKSIFRNEYTSEADDANFFLSPEGKHSPESELIASVNAFMKKFPLDDNHPQCKFPARFIWLKKQLQFDDAHTPRPWCTELEKWKVKFASDTVTLVFAESYLNNPASVFGHTFIRFDKKNDTTSNSQLTSFTFSYVADKQHIKTIYDYYVGGLVTGTPGTFEILPYYQKLNTYSDIENRDIWEFNLNLSQEEIEMLAYHLWELRDKNFDYFFITENCSYRIISIIDAILPSISVSRKFKGQRTIPVDTIKALENAGLIKGYKYRPSNIGNLSHEVATFDKNTKILIKDIATKNYKLNFDESNVPNINYVAKISLDYLSILLKQDNIDRDFGRSRYQEIAEFTAYHKPNQIRASSPPPSPEYLPTRSHNPSRLNLSVGKWEDTQFLSTEYRYAYHSLTDPATGFRPGSNIEIFKLEARLYKNNELRLHKLTLLDMVSLNPVNEYFTPTTWSISIKREKRLNNPSFNFVNRLDAGVGLTVKKGLSLTYGMITASIEHGNKAHNSYSLGPGIKMGTLYTHSRHVEQIEINQTIYQLPVRYSDSRIRAIHSTRMDQNNALKIQIEIRKIEREYFRELVIGISHFF